MAKSDAHLDFERLYRSMLAQIPETARHIIDDAMLRACVERALRHDLGWLEDMEFARGFASHCPVEGAQPEDYLHRISKIGDDLALVGIRFKGGDVTHPFVDVLAHTCESYASTSFGAMLDTIMRDYALFSPGSVRVRAGAGVEVFPEGWRASVDQYVLAARVSEMARGEVSAQVRLEQVVDLDEAAEFIETHYAETFAESAMLADAISPADREEIEEYMDSGQVSWIVCDGERAGLIAVSEAKWVWCEGACVMEEIVAPAHRGKRLAAQAQILMARQLDEAIFWGTIDARNQASLRTAERAGRQRIAAWHWIERLDT